MQPELSSFFFLITKLSSYGANKVAYIAICHLFLLEEFRTQFGMVRQTRAATTAQTLESSKCTSLPVNAARNYQQEPRFPKSKNTTRAVQGTSRSRKKF